MSAVGALRAATRAGPARLVAGMRVSVVPSLARPMSRVSSVSMVRAAGVRAFSVTAGRLGSGATDISLSQKLQEEIKHEQEQEHVADTTTPEFLQTFLEQGTWSISDNRGHDEVTLTRKFGDENIRLMFSIADLQNEDNFEPDLEEQDQDDHPDLQIRVALSITKSNGPGALNVDMFVDEGVFTIDSISFYDDAKLGTDLTADADWNRRGRYIGPGFDTLDPTVQEEFDRYLQERGVNETIATFIPEYAAYKEQQEYVKWLSKVKNFVDL